MAAVSIARAQPLAFPGAQGFGRFATGGRGGSVYYVTTTNDTGPGSFRDAVSQPNRTVVFAVSGVLDYQPPRYNVKNNVTIAGQTAPGDGVVLYGDGIGFTDANNTLTRFLRFRMGSDAVGEDTVGVARGHDMIFDHISATWSLDEVFSISGTPDPANITIQSSIIGQGLEDHSAGGLIQTDGGVSILRCLYIDNGTRNPKVKGVNEFVNNVVYNWKTDAYILGDSAGDSYANVMGNYFINGPDSGNDDAFSRGNLNFHLFATNNWQDKNRNGMLDGLLLTQPDYDVNDWQTVPFAHPISVSEILPALTAVKLAASDVGPSWRRDEVDERLITELTSWGTLGQTIFTEFDPPMNGPGFFKGGPVPPDSDLDGMPDYWEAGLGLATNAPNNNDPSPGGLGYTRLEDYLNWLAEPHGVARTNSVLHIDLRQFTRGFVNFSPIFVVNGASNGVVTLTNGHIARFVPTPGFVGLAGFGFSVTDAQGSTLSRPIGLYFTPQPPANGRVWRGDAVANRWDVSGDANWFDEQALLYPFQQGDAVEFDHTGSTSPAVNLVGSVEPSSVLVTAATDYHFAGPGSLEGATSLVLKGGGALHLDNTNAYTGATIVSNGTLLVNGSLLQSTVTVRSGATLGGSGRLGAAPALNLGATLAPGGVGSPGLLTVSNALTLAGGVTNRFDLSDDPSGLSKTNDRIQVVGTLNLSGANRIVVSLMNGPLANGVYTLITYSNLSGSLANLTLVGANGVLTNPPGAIAIYVDNTRPPASLVWEGNGLNNNWDDGVTPTWMNGVLPDWFYFGDAVRFDDTGSASPPVNLVGTVSPASVLVDAAQNYTFSGTGKNSGTGGLTKTNSGTLTITTANDYTGITTLAGGVLSVASLPDGGAAGSIGAAAAVPANLVFNGGTLRVTGGNDSTDRGATLQAGGGTMEVQSASTVLTLSGTVVGPGPLVKAGPGRLDMNAANSYSGGTTVNAGDVRLVNLDGFGSGPITLNGTVANAATFRFGSDAQQVPNTLVINGTNNRVLIRGNNTLSQLQGSGTFEGGLVDSGTTLTFGGNMSGFSGTFRAGTVANPRFNGSTGSAAATFDLGNGSAKLNNRNGNLTASIGALIGGPNTSLEGASSANSPTTYVIGGNNLSTTFAGRIQEVIPARSAAITKVGTGTLILTGNNTHNGATLVNGGTLLVNNISGSGTGTNSVTVNNGGTLGGTGFIHGPVTVNSGGTLAPGSSVGTLTLNQTLTLNPGARMRFELGLIAASDKVAVNGALALGGTLDLTNVAGFGPGTYTLFTCSGTPSGSLPVIGSAPAGYNYAVNTATPGQVRLVVTALALQPQTTFALDVNGLTLGGVGGAAGRTYHLLTSTNLTVPAAQWTAIATNQFDFNGQAVPFLTQPGQAQQFFRLHLP